MAGSLALEGMALAGREAPAWADGRSANIPPNVAVLRELKALEAELARRGAMRAAKADDIEATIPAHVREFALPYRYKGMHGGRGGVKSHTFARLLLARALRRPGTRWLCVREVQLSLAQSVRQLLKDLIERFGLEAHGFRVLDTRIDTPGGGVFVFQGMQNHTSDSVKSFEGFDGAWVEEAHSFSKKSLELLRPTIRKEGSELWFSWNPDKPEDPVDALLRGPNPPARSLVRATNWRDNPHFPAELKEEMDGDRERDPEGAAHVWDGAYATRSKASVFKNLRFVDFETPPGAAFLFGGDWGFSQDPTVLLRMFTPTPRVLCIDDEAWAVGCEIDDTPALFDQVGAFAGPEHVGMARRWTCRADSARPETISYMQRHGYPLVIPADKGPGSIEDGCKFLQNFLEIRIHSRCPNARREFMGYRHKVHPQTGEVTALFEDKKNHTVDSGRYGVEALRKAQGLTW